MSMDWLLPLRVFVTVVHHGNLSSAGRQLGLSPASVSRHIGSLEGSLGCRLINRSSRKLTLTDSGALYAEQVEQILQQLEDANNSVAQHQANPSGLLRVHSRTLIGNLHVVHILPTFLARHPDITIQLQLSNRVVNLVNENIDVDIRIGKLVDSSLVARKLAAAERVLCATPAYLAQRGTPATPGDLTPHNCLTYRLDQARPVWRFVGPDGALEEVPITGSLETDNGPALHAAVLAGLGIALMPDWSVRAELASGQLQRVLPTYRVSQMDFDNGVYAVFQKSRFMSAKLRAFVDFLVAAMPARLGVAT